MLEPAISIWRDNVILARSSGPRRMNPGPVAVGTVGIMYHNAVKGVGSNGTAAERVKTISVLFLPG